MARVLTQYIHQEIHNYQQGQDLQFLDAESIIKITITIK
jgi:hypothetical protein